MIPSNKPIYNGTKFRSDLEGRWAVFFDALGIIWMYEIQTFEWRCSDKKIIYTPDFWLPQVSMWAEVKPKKFNDKEVQKAFLLAKESRKAVLALINTPNFQSYYSYEVHLNCPLNQFDNNYYKSVHSCSAVYYNLVTEYLFRESRFPCMEFLPEKSEYGDAYINAVYRARNYTFEYED